MDDYNISNLTESRNEWTARLVTILYPFIIEGFKSIYSDAYKLCIENDEEEKYLMTFQNLLSQIPKWNSELIDTEVKRIKTDSKCGYIEDLITCVHIIQLKTLTCVRVGQHQKKVDIDIPNFNNFIHKIYILTARKLYSNIYLFQKGISPLDIQRHNREIELIVKECILHSIRDTIPVEEILRSYLDEVTEENVEVSEEMIPVENTEDNVVDTVTNDETIETEAQTADNNDHSEKNNNSKNNIIIEEVTNENSSVKLKDNDNIIINDDNYGIMLDVNDLVTNETETINKDTSNSEPNSEPDINTDNIINPIANDVNVSFSNDVDYDDLNEGDDKLNISDSTIALDDIESLDDPLLDNIEVLG